MLAFLTKSKNINMLFFTQKWFVPAVSPNDEQE